MKHLITVFIFFVATTLAGCNNFEKKFYKAIDDGEIKVIKNKNDDVFNLSKITNFKWDSVLIIRGNESVPVTAEEIEVDLKRTTTDLPTNVDRFYFLQHDKSIIIKEIGRRNLSDKSAYEIELCLIDSTQHRSWLAQRECIFKLMSNTRKVGNGTIFLFPPCNTTVVPDSLKIF